MEERDWAYHLQKLRRFPYSHDVTTELLLQKVIGLFADALFVIVTKAGILCTRHCIEKSNLVPRL